LDSGSRSQHLLALAFWVISFLTYEIASVPMIAAGLLYLRRAPRARALRHWAVDAAVLIPLFVLEALFKSRLQASSDTTILASFSTATSHVKALVTETFSLLGPVAFPFRMSTAALQNANAQSTIHRPMGLWPLLALAVVAVALFVRRRARPEVAAELTRWLGIAAGSVVALVAAYLVFVPASSGYTPLQQGINNRTNAVAAFAWVPLLYSVFMLAGICLSAGLTRRSSLSSVFALCACAVVAVGYVRFDLADKQHWSRAYEAEVATLDGIRAAVPSASADSTFYVLVRRTETAPGVRIFVARADLAGALAYRYGKYGIAALPVARSIGSFTCSRRTMKFNAPEDLSIPATPYRHVIAVNGLGDAFRRVPIRGAADCRRFGAALALPSLNG
jgi:hypothetical protein